MARIIAYTVLTPGHVYPFIPILQELQRRGHNPLLVVFTERDDVEQVGGIRVRVVNRSGEGPLGSPLGLDGTTIFRQGRVDFSAYGEVTAAVLERMIAQEQPDLLVVDPKLWGGMTVAEASGLPWVSVSHNPMTVRGLGLDARGPGLPPARGFWGGMLSRLVSASLHASDARVLPELNAVRAARGLAPLAHPWELYNRPPLIIATTAEPFEYPRSDWSPSVRFVGPLLWEPPAQPPDWLGELDGSPLILLVGSSIPEVGKARSWVRIAIEALATEPFQVVATLPTDDIPQQLPANVRVERFIPHGHLLPRAACVVCHGGPGITQKALAAGVPVVAVPFAYDRFEVARRVEVAGAGVMLPGNRLSPARLRVAVRKAIECKPGAERIAEAFRRSGGATAAADAIENLLGAWARG